MSKPQSKNNKFISVFIPVFNGEKYLDECIKSVLSQELPAGYSLELLIIDSGSSDQSLEIIEEYKRDVTLMQIPNHEFTHGGTRQEAARVAKGEFILFLTQDATPAHDRWLISMIEPFYISDKVGCVFGNQVPRDDAAPTIKREVSGAFAMCSRDSILIHRQRSIVDGTDTNTINSFFSDANSAVRRSLLLSSVPFRKVKYAEDQALAIDMQSMGYLKAYSPQGEVRHSNEYTSKQYFHRKFDEFIGLYDSLGIELEKSRKNLLFGWVRPTLKDFNLIIHDGSYGPRKKVKWFFLAPAYNFANCAGRYFAISYYKNEKKQNRLSLETNNRKKPKS